MTRSTLSAAALAMALVLPWPAAAQRQPQPPREPPKAPIVQGVGCAEQRPGSPSTWWLVRASSDVAPPGPFHITQVEKAKGAALGTNAFRLVGEADFLSTDELLKSGERARFTTVDTANASGQLRVGRKVLVKGLLVEVGGEQRINLMSVVSLAESCG